MSGPRFCVCITARGRMPFVHCSLDSSLALAEGQSHLLHRRIPLNYRGGLLAHGLPQRVAMAIAPPTPAPAPAPTPNGFHGAVSEFKRRLIEATLIQLGGNRTRAARALGLQRTYLLRLIREFQVRIPPPPGPWRRSNGATGDHGTNGQGGASHPPPPPSQRV